MRLALFLFLFPPLVLVLSCTSLTHKADTLDSKLETRLLMYKEAQSSTEPEKSCQIYSQLAQESNFPLKDIALIRAHIKCKDNSQLPKLAKVDHYLSEEDAERQWVESLRSNNLRDQAEALLRKAKLSNRIAEKTELLRLAIAKLKQGKAVDEDPLMMDLYDRLYKIAPRFINNPTQKDYYRVAQDYIYQRDFEKGRLYLNKILNKKRLSFEEEYSARRLLRTSYKIQQNRARHIIEARKLSNWLSKTKHYEKDLDNALFYARAVWTEGRSDQALKIMSQAEKRLKKKANLAELNFIRGKIYEERRDFKKSLSYYDQALKEVVPKSALREKILFSEAWAFRKLGQMEDAKKAFEDLQQTAKESFDHAKYSYWLARTYRDLGENFKADETFQILGQEDALGFYGMLSYRELNIDIPPLNLDKKKSPWGSGGDNISQADHLMVLSLIFTKEHSLLERFLNVKFQDLQASKNENEADWLYFLTAYAKAGLYLPLFQQLGILPSKIKSQLLERHPDLLFPQQYAEEIRVAAEKHDVAPEWILALIRQESAFNPQARSPADALGLMQLLPSVGKKHGKQIGIEVKNFNELFDPKINVEIGTYFASLLQKKYRNQFILATAAYNANERAIRNWLNTRLDHDPVEFIEEIPYEETRGYVKLVLRNYIFYTRLSKPTEKLSFPHWCLEDLHSFKVSTNTDSVSQ